MVEMKEWIQHICLCFPPSRIVFVVGGGEGLSCVVEMKEWIQHICLCFPPSRIVLVESTHLFRGSVHVKLGLFFSQARYCTMFTLHNFTDFYVERVTAHCIKINDHSCFHTLWQNSKIKLKLKHFGEQGGPLVFRGP